MPSPLNGGGVGMSTRASNNRVCAMKLHSKRITENRCCAPDIHHKPLSIMRLSAGVAKVYLYPKLVDLQTSLDSLVD